ncbi:STAS domain-containing protein [Streptomyces sp. NPDC001817]|uniref:STAS domain-containing protein n=1 Tax=Streptomyces sp. NPDC001817 TaxID=3154398 RepID=UPI003318890B
MTTQDGTPALFEECRIVRAHGELDRQTVGPLARALAEARAAGPGRLLFIVDLSEATFTDCSVLTPLCDAWYDCRARSGSLRIVHGNQTTDLVFRCTGLVRPFPHVRQRAGRLGGTNGRPRRSGSAPTTRVTAPASRADAAPAAEEHRPGRGRRTAPNHSTGRPS